MKKILQFILLSFFLANLSVADEKWGDEHFTKIEPEKDKKNYQMQAKLLCDYLKKNTFLDMVENKNVLWVDKNSKIKTNQKILVEASMQADKKMRSSCEKHQFYGNVLNDTWGSFFTTCTVKNQECMDLASRYMERAALVSKSMFEAMKSIPNLKSAKGSTDCSGMVSSQSRNSIKDLDKISHELPTADTANSNSK